VHNNIAKASSNTDEIDDKVVARRLLIAVSIKPPERVA
jgi:hypothetical protein